MPIARKLRFAGGVALMAALAPGSLAAQHAPPPTAVETGTTFDAEAFEFDTDFVVMAVLGDMFKIEAGKLALRRAANTELRAFAAHMIADHHAMALQLRQAARALRLPVPVTLDGRRESRLKHLADAATETDFDYAYIAIMLRVHREAMALHLAYAAGSGWPSLKAMARQALPRLQAHLARLEEIHLAVTGATVAQDGLRLLVPPPAHDLPAATEDD